MLAFKDFLEALNSIFNLDELSSHTGENLSNGKWLRQISLDLTGAG